MNGVRGTAEGTAHAKKATVGETDSFLGHCDVLRRTIPDAKAAAGAFLGNAEGPAKKAARLLLDTEKTKEATQEGPCLHCRSSSLQDDLAIQWDKGLCRLPHPIGHVLGVAEDHIVRHKVVELSFDCIASFPEYLGKTGGGVLIQGEAFPGSLHHIDVFVLGKGGKTFCERQDDFRRIEGIVGKF